MSVALCTHIINKRITSNARLFVTLFSISHEIQTFMKRALLVKHFRNEFHNKRLI